MSSMQQQRSLDGHLRDPVTHREVAVTPTPGPRLPMQVTQLGLAWQFTEASGKDARRCEATVCSTGGS